MRSAIEIPFDASKYAFRTNFDGLTSTNDAIKAHVDKLAEQYKQSLTNHESNDKAARKAHSEEKEEGMTEAGFGEWVGKNYPTWAASRDELSHIGAQLTRAAADAFGTAYTEKLKKEQDELNQEGWKAGYQPDLF